MRFAEYWPLYLQAHRQRTTRGLHYAATIVGLSTSAAGLLMLDAIVLVAGIGGGYALAISSHFLFEGNRPMIAVNPVWGAFADMRMTWLAATGRLPAELHRHRIEGAPGGAASP
ncbi:MAG: Mpo1-like protein [Dongiaceae bacterium]